MSDTEMTPTKPMAWTEEAKFLMRIIAQLRGDGKPINWTRLQMDGRTTKSLQNQWFKISKEISEMENAENGETAATPSKPKATPRKGRGKKVEKSEPLVAPGASDDDEGPEVKVTPKKRGSAARRGGGKASAKRVKQSDSDDEKPKEESHDNDEDGEDAKD